MTCIPADDAYLIQAFPGVVQMTPERWIVTVVDAEVGEYSIEMGGIIFADEGVLADTITTIRDKLAFQLGSQTLAAISSTGVSSIQIDEVQPGGLDIVVTGPTEGSITATKLPGTGDINEAFRLFWLERALCGLPPCCVITCQSDYTLMHAALAAHLIFTFANLNKTGSSVNDFQSMKLGPASLTKGKSGWNGNPADGDLAQTGPGQLFLALRARYVFGFVCV